MKSRVMINKKIMIKGAVYHITQRAPGNDKLFLEDSDYLRFLALLKRAASLYRLDVASFVLMTNHVHILVKINKKNLDRSMKYVFQRYAQYFNKKYNRKGHVFCGVYRATLVDSKRYLLTASLYIHLNPYKAGLVIEPIDYRWSSITPFCVNISKTFLKPRIVLDVLNAKSDKVERFLYKKLINEGKKRKYKDFLKSEYAIEQLSTNIGAWLKASLTLEHMDNEVIEEYDKMQSLISKVKEQKRLTPETKKAVEYLKVQFLSQGYTTSEISTKIGISRATLNRLNNDEITGNETK